MADLARRYPALRRFLTGGFRHNPLKDAPHYGLICVESANQRLYVDPETGLFRAGNAISL